MSATFPQLSLEERPPVHLTLYAAVATWMLAWFCGVVLGQVPLAIWGDGADATGLTAAAAVATVVAWSALLAGAVAVSHRFGTAHPARDYGLRFRPIDVLGVPIGVATQLVLVPALYWPLVELWPATFDDDKLERNARELVDATHGGGWVLLLAIVAVGAPVVEEIVYRGLIHGAAVRRFGHVWAVVVSSALFALIHFRPVEYPGLFLIGVILAVCFSLTRRLGMSITAHAAFNLTALIVTARR